MWNELIAVRDKYSQRLVNGNIESRAYKANVKVRDMASMLLRQLNTAGGKERMGTEVESFLNKFGTYQK